MQLSFALSVLLSRLSPMLSFRWFSLFSIQHGMQSCSDKLVFSFRVRRLFPPLLLSSHAHIQAYMPTTEPEHLEKTHTGTQITCRGSAGSNPKSSCCEKSTRCRVLDYNWNLIQATFVFTTILYIAADITEKKKRKINSCCQLRAAGICYISNWSDVAHCHTTIMHSRATQLLLSNKHKVAAK